MLERSHKEWIVPGVFGSSRCSQRLEINYGPLRQRLVASRLRICTQESNPSGLVNNFKGFVYFLPLPIVTGKINVVYNKLLC